MFDYYTLADSEQIRFYQLPKELVKNERFKTLTDSAKILYSLLRDRVSLSVKNNWVDELGRVYIIFTLAEIMENLGCADQKATKSMKELQKMGLVESIRRGLGKPNVIYVKNFATDLKNTKESHQTLVSTQIRENHESGLVKITNPDSLKSRIMIRENHDQSILILNDTDLTDTESKSASKSDCEILHKEEDMTMTSTLDVSLDLGFIKEEGLATTVADKSTGLQSPPNVNTVNDDYTTYRIILQDNIEYSHYLTHRKEDVELVEELINCILDVICTKGDTVKINGEDKNRQMVISQYLKINSLDIDHILSKYREQRHRITHLHSYLKTMLYTVKQEANAWAENAVRADGLVW